MVKIKLSFPLISSRPHLEIFLNKLTELFERFLIDHFNFNMKLILIKIFKYLRRDVFYFLDEPIQALISESI